MKHELEGHTVQRYDGELNTLHLRTLEMGGLALSQLQVALKALRDSDTAAAATVIEREPTLDRLEVTTDDEIASVIARRAPVAKDLRVIIAFSKAITDMERIGDEAARIAFIVEAVLKRPRSHLSKSMLRDIFHMGDKAITMLQDAMTALDNLDLDQAEAMMSRRDDLDDEFQSGLRKQATFVLEDPRNVGQTINTVLIMKALERIGDHARNLCEYVIYLVKGEDVRHRVGRMAHGTPPVPDDGNWDAN
jgi:phosphate transport system protein